MVSRLLFTRERARLSHSLRLTTPPAAHTKIEPPRSSSPSALLIEREPNNLQAQSLNQLIEKGIARGESAKTDLK